MNQYIGLARKTILTFLQSGKIIKPPANLPEEFFQQQAGVFVSLKKQGQLRGCIGTFLPTQKTLAEEIIANAIAAATEDPRFPAVNLSEFEAIDVSVDVLSRPVEVAKEGYNKLNPQRYGLIVKSADSRKTGLLLPALLGVDTVDEQIRIACQKAGISPGVDNYYLYKFTVTRHEAK